MAKVFDADVMVRASVTGYVGGEIRPSGAVFLWPAGVPVGSWVVMASGEDMAEADVEQPVEPVKPKGKKKGKAETVEQPDIEPFGEAPAPTTVQGNGIKEALGIEPDWLPPGANGPVLADD